MKKVIIFFLVIYTWLSDLWNDFYDIDTHNLLEEYRNKPEEIYHECTEQDH